MTGCAAAEAAATPLPVRAHNRRLRHGCSWFKVHLEFGLQTLTTDLQAAQAWAGPAFAVHGTHSNQTAVAAACLKRAECGPQRRHKLRGVPAVSSLPSPAPGRICQAQLACCQFSCHAGRSPDLHSTGPLCSVGSWPAPRLMLTGNAGEGICPRLMHTGSILTLRSAPAQKEPATPLLTTRHLVERSLQRHQWLWTLECSMRLQHQRAAHCAAEKQPREMAASELLMPHLLSIATASRSSDRSWRPIAFLAVGLVRDKLNMCSCSPSRESSCTCSPLLPAAWEHTFSGMPAAEAHPHCQAGMPLATPDDPARPLHRWAACCLHARSRSTAFERPDAEQ